MPASLLSDAHDCHSNRPCDLDGGVRVRASARFSRAALRRGRGRRDGAAHTVPENRDVLFLLALGQRQMVRTADALTTSSSSSGSIRLQPPLQERGYCYVAMKDAPQATQAFLQAVAINPHCRRAGACWKPLRMSGDAGNAAPAAATSRNSRPCRRKCHRNRAVQ